MKSMSLLEFNNVLFCMDIHAVDIHKVLKGKIDEDLYSLGTFILHQCYNLKDKSPFVELDTDDLSFKRKETYIVVPKHQQAEQLEKLFIYTKTEEIITLEYYDYLKENKLEKYIYETTPYFNMTVKQLFNDPQIIIVYDNTVINQYKLIITYLGDVLAVRNNYVDNLATIETMFAKFNEEVLFSVFANSIYYMNNVLYKNIEKRLSKINYLERYGFCNNFCNPLDANVERMLELKKLKFVDTTTTGIIKLWDINLTSLKK